MALLRYFFGYSLGYSLVTGFDLTVTVFYKWRQNAKSFCATYFLRQQKPFPFRVSLSCVEIF